MARVPNQTSSQIPRYENCLLVSRHQLLPSQQADLEKICEKISKTDMLPTDTNDLKKFVEPYNAVIGVVPLVFQVQLLQWKKAVVLFYMEAIGTVGSKAEAEQLLTKSGLEGVILPPAKEGEPYRVSVYKGLLMVKEIKIVDEFIIKHG